MIIKSTVRQKLYVALCGMPDSGKSTFIKHFVKVISGRDVSVDSLCDEEKKEMTIRSAQIVCRNPKLDYDIVLLDCPGHLELDAEIRSCLSKASVLIKLTNANDNSDDVKAYFHTIDAYCMSERDINYDVGVKSTFNLTSHSSSDKLSHYDIEHPESVEKAAKYVLDELKQLVDKTKGCLENPFITAVRTCLTTLLNAKNPAGMISFGKDSLVVLDIANAFDVAKKIKWYYPMSGYDMDCISEDFIKSIEARYNITITPFDVLPEDKSEWNFENKSVQEMMLKKAEMLNNHIASNNHDYVLMGIRRDEEGVRAKEKFFSIRSNDGSADLYEAQYEQFYNEHGFIRLQDGQHCRVHPLLDMTEADTWLYIKWKQLPFVNAYISKNGKRYRSLGDKPITTPIDSNASNIDEIVEEVLTSLVPERACRAKQDNAVKGTMETIRAKGFF